MPTTPPQPKPRIGIFLANWSFQSHTSNAALIFARAGYDVDLFLFKPRSVINLDRLCSQEGVTVHDLTPPDYETPSRFRSCPLSSTDEIDITPKNHNSLLWRLIHRVRFLYSPWMHYWRADPVIPFDGPQRALRIIGNMKYRCLIGVEPQGLVWASRVAARLGVPYLYHSLELWLSNYQRLYPKQLLPFWRLRASEARAHRGATATIIQDVDRARLLFADNHVRLTEHNALYVPVGRMGAPVQVRSDFLQVRFKLPPTQRVILYFGGISQARYCADLVKVAQRFPPNWTLVMHGYLDPPSFIRTLQRLDPLGKVVLSLDPLDDEHLTLLISSADIGLAFYSPTPLNDRLTAFASEKVALYAQCGVPCVAFDYPGYRKLATEDGCGVVIRELKEVPSAIQSVLANYSNYRECAFRAYTKYYRYDQQFAKVVQYIDHCQSKVNGPCERCSDA